MAATGTSLGCVTRVDTQNLHPLGFRLVGEKHPELGEAPGVQAAARFPTPLPGAGADVHQVLHHNYGAGLDGIDDTPTQHMVAVAPEAVDLPGQLAEVPLGRAGAFALEAATEPEVPALDLLPAAFAKESVVGTDSRARKAQVHPNDISRRLELHVGDGDDDMQPEPPFAVDQVGAVEADGLVQNALGVRVNGERHLETPTDRGQAHGALLWLDGIRAGVVADRDKRSARTGGFLPLLSADQSGLHGFRRPHARGNHQLRGEVGEPLAQTVVRGVVQPDAVLLRMHPAVGAHGVEAFGVLAEGFQERVRLLGSWVQLETGSSLHVHIVSHFVEGGKAALLPMPEGRGLRAAVV